MAGGAPRPTENQAGRPRQIDYAEARRMRKRGATYAEIGVRFGVSASGARLACDDQARARVNAYHALWQQTGECIDCGTRISRNASQPARRCRPCSAKAQTTTVRRTTLKCCTCKDWKHDQEFPWNRSQESERRRGRHKSCRACLTVLKRDYRERHKTPCARCGAPTSPVSERKRYDRENTPTGLCLSCYRESLRTAA